jgi:hypothetical protein
MKDSLYKQPKTIFQDRINEIVESTMASEIIKDLIHLQMFKSAEKNSKNLALVEVFNLLGVEKFTELIDLLDGKTIKFPTKETLKEYVIIALCFYHKKYYGRTWNEIKEIIGDDKLKSIKYGLRVQNLETFIKYLQDRTGERFSLEGLENGINGRDA